MPRMHGERQQDFWLRQQSEAESKRVTAEYEQRLRDGKSLIVEETTACTCSEFPYPHIHQFQDTWAMLRRRCVEPRKYMSGLPSAS